MIDRRKFLATSAVTGLAGCAEIFRFEKSILSPSSSTIQKYADLLTPERLRSRLYFIASDLFEGRRTGSRGQQLAASYLASEYAHMGFAPPNQASDRSLPEGFFQRFSCYCKFPKSATVTVSLAAGKTLQVSNVGSVPQLYFAGTEFRDVSSPLVFAGYGIEDLDKKYQDYTALRNRGISIDGKWVTILDGEPAFFSGADGKASKWSNGLIAKRLALAAAGQAQGLLIVSNLDSTSPEFQIRVKQVSGSTGKLLPLRLDWPASSNPVTLVIARDAAQEIFKAANATVEDVANEIGQTRAPRAIDFDNLQVKAEFESFPPVESENVVATLEGSDTELRKEFVVVSAHHDHLGIDSTLSGHQIFNGAADDGSGTVALLEIASAFARAKAEGAGPRRSLVFLHTTGEEAGLLGSAYFVDEQPLVSLDAITADLNLDGIAGFDPKHPRQSKNYLYVVVGPAEMSDVVARARKLVPNSIELDPHDDFSSDNRSFWRHQIPFIYYSTGFVNGYHQPSDEAAAIDYEQFARAAQISFATAWELANQPTAIPHKPQSELKLAGYFCPPCNLPCDDRMHEAPGSCPICGMTLVKKFT